MRLPGLVRCVRACVRVCARPRVCVCVSLREREMRVGVCTVPSVRVYVWEAIWCMGVSVKVDRMRIVIILVPRIYIYIAY